jgi:hypothetical protein
VSSVARSIHAVELAIIAAEGTMVVEGVRHESWVDAYIARHALAERAIAEASIVLRYVRLEPPCAYCGFSIRPTQLSREIDDRLFHDTDEHPCAQAFEDEAGPCAVASHPGMHPDEHRALGRLDARPITSAL